MNKHRRSLTTRTCVLLAAPDGTIDGGGNRAQSNLGGDCTAVECR